MSKAFDIHCLPRINSITFAGSQGGYSYTVGSGFDKGFIAKIEVCDVTMLGDPYPHYAGYNKEGEIVFLASCINSCIVLDFSNR